ncbi:Rha family transcriptional regulator [Paraburkholderia sp. CI2]|uniref:Rha family transcriptional regulator n=1 Tax=Paraburkholderia sp. CI2 TaxID=2723093 RepID=UPI00160FB4FC|nr:Rha family transcriptional regulator [Paraburkholderia sp. CI2]
MTAECPSDFAEANFGFCTEASATQRGKSQPFYVLTKDGFMFLVMGFTGKAAASMKEAFIEAFNAMAEHNRASGNQPLCLAGGPSRGASGGNRSPLGSQSARPFSVRT